MTKRIAAFIDGAYFEKILRDDFGQPRIDYQKLSASMSTDVDHLRTYYYNCLPYMSPTPTEEELERLQNRQRFYHALERIDRFEVRLGKLALRGNMDTGNYYFEQKGVDVLLAVDMTALAMKRLVTHVSVLTADDDFVPALRLVKQEGVIIRLFHYPRTSQAHDLWTVADERVVIDSNFVQSLRSDF